MVEMMSRVVGVRLRVVDVRSIIVSVRYTVETETTNGGDDV
jgi:hypothetical protein